MTWHLIAHVSELAEENDFVCLPWRADGGEVAVMRQAGELVAFDNLCPHRGARIFASMFGRRPPRCVYHGRLASASQVRRFPLRVAHGFVWVNDDETARGGLDLRGPVRELFEEAAASEVTHRHSALTFTQACHWTVAVENALDFEHVATVHEGSLAALMLQQTDLQLLSDGSSIERFRSANPRLAAIERFFEHGKASFDYVHAHLYPFAALSSTCGFTWSLQNYFPRADGTTTFLHRLYAAPTTRDMSHYFDSVREMNARVFQEDAEVCALVPAGHDGHLGTHETRIAHFRASCAAYPVCD